MSYPLGKVTLSIVLDTRREKAGGYYPVKYRVTYSRRQYYYPCMDMTPEQYSSLHGRVKTREKAIILEGFETLKNTLQEMIAAGDFSMELFNRRLSRGQRDSVFDAFDSRIAELEAAGKPGSVTWYKCARRSIEKFAHPRDLSFADITPAWLARYEQKMLEEGKEYTTISINLRALRAIMNQALRDGIIPPAQYPFSREGNKGYRIPEARARKIALSEQQLINVINYPVPPGGEMYRDLWLFSMYANGANISDIARLKWKNLSGDFLEWHRGKTASTDREKMKIRAFVRPEMADILKRYGNTDRKPESYIFPFLHTRMTPSQERAAVQDLIHRINKRMKSIGRALGIGDITTYWARHTWASISRSKGVSLYGISKALGHKNLTTTQIYLDSLSDEEIINNAKLLPGKALIDL